MLRKAFARTETTEMVGSAGFEPAVMVGLDGEGSESGTSWLRGPREE